MALLDSWWDWNWQAIAVGAWTGLVAFGAKLGVGGGLGALQFLRVMPPPRVEWLWRAALIDTIWAVVGNGRVGERRTKDGETVWIERKQRPTAQPPQTIESAFPARIKDVSP